MKSVFSFIIVTGLFSGHFLCQAKTFTKTFHSSINKTYVFEGSGQVGWMFSGKNSTSKINNAVVYTLTAAYIKNERTMYELSANSLFTSVHYLPYNGHPDTTANYSQTYVMFGLVRMFDVDIPKLSPYFSTMIGFMNRSVQVVTSDPQTQLAVGMKGGLKYFVKDNWGLKVQARIQAPITGFGLGVGVSTSGPSVGVGSYSNFIQFDIGAGVFFRL